MSWSPGDAGRDMPPKTLQEARLEQGISLRSMARKLAISATYLSRMENGIDPVPSARIREFETTYDVQFIRKPSYEEVVRGIAKMHRIVYRAIKENDTDQIWDIDPPFEEFINERPRIEFPNVNQRAAEHPDVYWNIYRGSKEFANG